MSDENKIKVVDAGIEMDEEDSDPLIPKLDLTILEIWQNLLKPIEEEQMQKLTPAGTMGILQRWPRLDIREVPAYSDFYYEMLLQLRDALDTLLKEHPDALENIKEDATLNKKHYVRLIAQWQLIIQAYEDEWNILGKDAEAAMGAIADVSNFALSSMGLVGHLDQIGLEVTSDDMIFAMKELKEERK